MAREWREKEKYLTWVDWWSEGELFKSRELDDTICVDLLDSPDLVQQNRSKEHIH